jgi:hypothetical protein
MAAFLENTAHGAVRVRRVVEPLDRAGPIVRIVPRAGGRPIRRCCAPPPDPAGPASG